MIKIAPSILAADFTKLGDEIKSIKTADYLHFDVMDGMFVSNISFGIPVLESVRKITNMTLDIHLMIDSPSRYVSRFAEAGGDIITFHVEAETHDNIHKALNTIHDKGKKAGLSIKPDTPCDALLPYLDSLDMVLIMTVQPGYGGQEFIQATLPKISELRDIIESRDLNCEIEVDGGINIETAGLCTNEGANVLVVGNDLFTAADRAAHIKNLRKQGTRSN